MRKPAQADLKRWSDDVARDPRSLAFLPLARAYRRRGLSEAATTLCLRGLEAYPTHVEAHGLLALLYLDRGDHQKAADEWSFVLRLDPDNFDALRGMGFCYLEQDQLSRARHMLERAALLRPTEPTVREAMRVLGTRQDLAQQGIGRKPDFTPEQVMWANELPESPAGAQGIASTAQEAVQDAAQETVQAGPDEQAVSTDLAAEPWLEGAPRSEEAASAAAAVGQTAPDVLRPTVQDDLSPDPERLFDTLLSAGPVLGALFVDSQGLVVAGRMLQASGASAAVLGAVVGGAAGEAVRTATHLGLGAWRGIHMEAGDALLHLVPAGADGVVVLAARPSTPAGWLRRAAAHAAERAQQYAEAYG
jgi:predicted regulator of Ras-like GTPase activity (Roadblock/LC7/MglB family)